MKVILRSNQGFTFLEVIVALAIISVSFLVILHSQSISMDNAKKAKMLSVAALLAQRKMAELELDGPPEPGREEGDFNQESGRFRWSLSVSKVEFMGSSLQDLRRVVLTVYGDEDVSRRTELITLLPVKR